MDNQQAITYGAMILFILTAGWNIVAYFLKKKDKISDVDHEHISNINSSIIEIRNTQKQQGHRIDSIDGHLESQDGVMNDHGRRIRDIEESLRTIVMYHEKAHNERMKLPGI